MENKYYQKTLDALRHLRSSDEKDNAIIATGIMMNPLAKADGNPYAVYIMKSTDRGEEEELNLLEGDIPIIYEYSGYLEEIPFHADIEEPIKLDDTKYDPLIGGSMISHGTSAGTLGCLVEKKGENTIYALTNQHVVDKEGQEIFHPQKSSSVCCTCECNVKGLIGKCEKIGKEGSNIDAAIINLKGGIKFKNEIADVGAVEGERIYLSSDELLNLPVKKRGIRTLLTTGVIEVVDLNITVAGKSYTNQLQIRETDSGNFANRGDSGSVLLDKENRVVGLIFAISYMQGATTNFKGICNPIRSVLEEMGVELILGRQSGENKFIEEENSVMISNFYFFPEPHRRLYAKLIHRHAEEVLDLVYKSRFVGVTWQRAKGPAYIKPLVDFANTGDESHLMFFDCYAFVDLLKKMGETLDIYGSDRLRVDLIRYREMVLTDMQNWAVSR